MDRKLRNNRREVAVRDFYGEGKHIYTDQLGWSDVEKREARSLVSKVIFDFEVVKVRHNLSFYYVDGDEFYGICAEADPIEVKKLERDRSEEFIGWQCEAHAEGDGEVLFSFEKAEELWDGIVIDGKNLEEVLSRSYILQVY